MHLLAFMLLFSMAFAVSSFKPMDDPLWKEFKLKFGKFYKDEQREAAQYMVWKQHLKDILKHNSNDQNTFKKGINHFSDLTHDEFRAQMGGCFKLPKHIIEGNITEGSEFMVPSNVSLPETVDWRTKGYVTPVKDQGPCGSCWAFSSTGSLEGQTFRKTGTLPNLSEQNLVDCTKSYGNSGCHGGWMHNAFKYIRDNKGIDSEIGYPYFARELGYCYYNSRNSTATDNGFVELPSGDEYILQVAVALIGPISVAIDCSQAFMSYSSGVYVEPNCGNGLADLNHAVLVVGYGSENGLDYWLVKNSWSSTWGDAGYIKMARNRNNQCGIATHASYPLV